MVNQLTKLGFFYQSLLIFTLISLSVPVKASIDSATLENKVVQIAVTEIPYSLSPYALNVSNALADQYSHLFFDPLVRWTDRREIEYRLLDKLEVLDNGKIRFYLKKNIFFHSGNLLTSHDVIWSLEEALNNKYLQRKLQHNINMAAVNAFQFDVQTKLSHPQLLDYLTHLFVLDSAYYTQHKIRYNFVQSPITSPVSILPLSGTGPYTVASFSPGLNLQVQVNRHYWKDEPTFKHLKFFKIKSLDSRLYALLAGDVDISESIANKNINSENFLKNKDIYQIEMANALFLTVNEQNKDTLRRQTTRNAIHLAINQTGILKHILNGTGKVDKTFKLTAPAVMPNAYDAPHAKYLLKKVGAPTQLSLLVMADQFSHTDEVVFSLKNMFKKVGIALTIKEATNHNEWLELQFDFDLTLSTWRSGLVEKSNVYQDIFSNSLISEHITMFFSEQKMRLTMDEKMALFEEAQLADKIIPIFTKNKIWAADKQFTLEHVFSVNAVPYWHLLTTP